MPQSESADSCVRCKTPLSHHGVEQFRIGGTTGGWKLLVGEWAEMGEKMIDIDMWSCPSCLRIELRRPA